MKDRYAQVYAQIEQETERYLRENTLCEGDIDRYGFGKHILRLLMSGLAMHAMGGMIGGSGKRTGTQSPPSPAMAPTKSPAARKGPSTSQRPEQRNQPEPKHDDPLDIDRENQERDKKLHEEGQRGLQQRLLNRQKKPRSGSATANLDFEKLHPRGQSQNAGQFAEKPGGDVGSTELNTTGIVHPSQPPRNATPDQILQHHLKMQAAVAARSQKAKENFGKPSAYVPPETMDATTAAVAEKWHGDKQEPTATRNYPDHNAALTSGNINLSKPRTQPGGTIEPTDDDLTAMQEDPYNYDPEQAAEPEPPAQEATPQAEAPRTTRMFTKKNWSAGPHQGSIGFQDEEHAAMHELGSKLHNQLSGHNSLRPGAKRPPNMERANKLAAEYAHKHGVDPAEIQTHASAVYRNNKAAMKGLADGEHRDVTYSGFKKQESQPTPDATQPTQPTKPDDDAKAQQQAEARAKRNAEHAAKVAAKKAAKPSLTDQKAAEKRVEFDPSEWENDDPIDSSHGDLQKPKASDFEGDEHEGRMSTHDAKQPRRESFANDEDHKAAHKKWKQDAPTFENATKKYNQQRGRQEASISRNTSANHVRDQALEHDLDHDELHAAVSDELQHALPTWQRSEEARKYWTTNAQGGKNGVNARHLDEHAEDVNGTHFDERADEWAGMFPEIAGYDESEHAAKAFEHVKAGPQPKPGHHNLEFVSSVAKRLAAQKQASSNATQQNYEYEEPPDGAPFSRKALTNEIDRYFNEARIQYRKQRQSVASAIWTDADRWL